jgi:TolB-like protein/pimeloyl-ACP methyl ester carboxylesterase
MMKRQGFWDELVRRKVVKVIVSYIAVAWILIQVADIALENFGAPAYFMQAFMLFALLGLPIVMVLSWVLEITPDGIRRDSAAPANISNLREAIAVLPFASMSSDPEIEYMADGLSDNIITDCQHHLDIDVTSRNSTFVYKNQPVSIANVASELNVAYVLEGSIQKQGQDIRVTAQLIKAADDSHLWADHFDHVLSNSFELQDKLTSSIVSAIKAVLNRPVEVAENEPGPGPLVQFLNLPGPLLFTIVGTLLLTLVSGLILLLPGPESLPGVSGLSFEVIGAITLTLSLLGLGAFYLWQRRESNSEDITEALNQIDQHVGDNHLTEAFDLATELREQLDGDHYNEEWWDLFSAQGELETRPENCEVSWRPYNGRNVPWRPLGKTPITTRLPLGSLQIKVSAEGYQTQEFVIGNRGINLKNMTFPTRSDLPEWEEKVKVTLGRHNEDSMVYASERYHLLSLTGLPTRDPILISEFLIDRYPITNADYQQFVDEGGYQNESLWEHLPWPDNLNWREKVSSFVDQTDKQGPSGWELGRFPEGEENMPVTGISWYEAAAYASHLGKRLPSVYEWARAALTSDAAGTTTPVAMMNFSNFLGGGKSDIGEFPSMNAIGTYDMFGNVREWAWNAVNEERCNLGGCDTDLPYFSVWVNSADPFARSENLGFRCVKGDPDPEQMNDIGRVERTYEGESPVADDVYEALVAPLRPRNKKSDYQFIDSAPFSSGVNVETFDIDSGYGERIPLKLIYPESDKPVKSLVLFPGMGSFMGTDGHEDILDFTKRLDFIVKQLGYAFVVPYWKAAFERFDYGPFPRGTGQTADIWMERLKSWNQESSQAISFIEEYDKLDASNIGFLGTSFGGINTLSLLALEERYKTGILFSSNLMGHDMFPFADAKNFCPRITCPMLLINGRYDTIVTPNEDILNLRLKWLGTPDEDKKQILYDAGHFPFPQNLLKKDIADWLHKYL